MVLSGVVLDCHSLQDAWKQVSERFMARSVLVLVEGAYQERPFRFSSSRCKTSDVFDALIRTYPEMQWSIDPQTKVVWFHPLPRPYVTLLNRRLHIEQDQLGLPMQTGLLEPLADDSQLGLDVKRWGDAGRNTFDYPVDVRAGDWTVRDVLNTACAANPTKSFYVQLNDERAYVTAVNLVSDALDAPPPGAIAWWRVHVDPRSAMAPTKEAVISALSDSRPAIRSAGRAYLEAIVWQISVEDWIREAQGRERSWLAVASLFVLSRAEGTTVRAAVEELQSAEGDLSRDAPPDLAILSALLLAKQTGDAAPVKRIAARRFTKTELDGVLVEAYALARRSPTLRGVLSEAGTDWLTRIEPGFQGIETSNAIRGFRHTQ
jgi:hypothetical protein